MGITFSRAGCGIGGAALVFVVALAGPSALSVLASDQTRQPTPPKYEAKVMPSGWRDNPKAFEAGRQIYEGRLNPDVNCAECHGIDGKPTRQGRGAPDLSDPVEAAKDSDGRWFWRVSEGKARTKMQGYQDKLSEEQRWQVVAYIRSFARK